MFQFATPLRLTVIAASALALTACSSGSGGHAGHQGEEKIVAPVEGAEELAVTAVDIDFRPESMQLAAGEPVNVAVTNEGATEHDFTLEEADVHVNVPPGESKTTAVTIDEPGTYTAICTVPGHEDAGMTIEVTVE